jgi:hypothetical protein
MVMRFTPCWQCRRQVPLHSAIVVPAKAGTHTPFHVKKTQPTWPRFFLLLLRWLWIPAGVYHRAALCADPLAGTTANN